MRQTKEQLVLTTGDYEAIKMYLKRGFGQDNFNQQDADKLAEEIKKARLVDEETLPADVVRLGSTVTIKEASSGKHMKLTIVIPERAAIKEKRISIMSPIGAALIGFRKGQQVRWKVPSGERVFHILEVSYT